jgi:hypothetical protein
MVIHFLVVESTAAGDIPPVQGAAKALALRASGTISHQPGRLSQDFWNCRANYPHQT